MFCIILDGNCSVCCVLYGIVRCPLFYIISDGTVWCPMFYIISDGTVLCALFYMV